MTRQASHTTSPLETTTQPNVKDVIIPADSIARAIEAGLLTGDEDLLLKLGELGVDGHKVDPADKDQSLVPYDHEKEGSLGWANRDEFIAAFDLVSEGNIKGAWAWTNLVTTSVSIAKDCMDWESPKYLERQQQHLSNTLARMPSSSRRRQRLEQLLGEVNDRLEGKAHGVPSAAFGPPPGEPFVFIEVGEADQPEPVPEPELIRLETIQGIDKTTVHLSWDALYKNLAMTEGVTHKNMGKKMRPLLIGMLNARIAASRESAATDVLASN